MQRDRLSGPLHGVDGPSLSWGLCLTPASGGEALHLSHPQVIKTCGLNLASLAERPLRENGSPLPPVVGFPHRCVLCSIRLPIRIRRAFPLTVLLRLPRAFSYPGASGASQVLRRLSSCMPRPEDSGGPSHPRLNGCSRIAFGVRENPRRPHLALSKRYQHFRGRGSPYGLQDTLSTPRPSCSPCYDHGSAMDARLDTGGWLPLTRQGLSPCKRRQAFLAQ
jgi:hypothetical protein